MDGDGIIDTAEFLERREIIFLIFLTILDKEHEFMFMP
jgi:hypothetical protein